MWQDNGGRLGLEVFSGSCIQVTHRESGDTLLAYATLERVADQNSSCG